MDNYDVIVYGALPGNDEYFGNVSYFMQFGDIVKSDTEVLLHNKDKFVQDHEDTFDSEVELVPVTWEKLKHIEVELSGN